MHLLLPGAGNTLASALRYTLLAAQPADDGDGDDERDREIIACVVTDDMCEAEAVRITAPDRPYTVACMRRCLAELDELAAALACTTGGPDARDARTCGTRRGTMVTVPSKRCVRIVPVKPGIASRSRRKRSFANTSERR